MKIYTKTGDAGETGLFAGPRVRKDHPRIEAYGAVDELNADLGVVRASKPPVDIDDVLADVQTALFSVGGQLATPDPAAHGMELVGEDDIARLEAAIDRFDGNLPPLKRFILPGGSPAAAALHRARCVCRRAERRVVTLAATPGETVSEALIRYLNRLSDLLFVLARTANHLSGVPEVEWQAGEKRE